MKVSGAKIFIVRVGGRCPVLVQLLTDQGVTGVGDAALAYGTGAESAAAMIKELVHQFVLGKDPFAIVIRTFKWFLKMIPAPRWHQHIDGILY